MKNSNVDARFMSLEKLDSMLHRPTDATRCPLGLRSRDGDIVL